LVPPCDGPDAGFPPLSFQFLPGRNAFSSLPFFHLTCYSTNTSSPEILMVPFSALSSPSSRLLDDHLLAFPRTCFCFSFYDVRFYPPSSLTRRSGDGRSGASPLAFFGFATSPSSSNGEAGTPADASIFFSLGLPQSAIGHSSHPALNSPSPFFPPDRWRLLASIPFFLSHAPLREGK